ncbi:MAG: hypothetical protein KatS3mg100_597 [Candidatus Parcubacteria bacterium]|nr:MAG: hypothetical protein KatS3mg100_597 [Candidatus Parcubacteria bacterium]
MEDRQLSQSVGRVEMLVISSFFLICAAFLAAWGDPALAAAKTSAIGCSAGERSICGIIMRVVAIVTEAVPVLVVAALIAFAVAILRFLWVVQRGGDLKQSKNLIWWGIIALATVMLSSGIVLLFQKVLFGV